MSASLVGSEMCIRDSARPCSRVLVRPCIRGSVRLRVPVSARQCASTPVCLLYTSDAADDM
eukprot:4833236-Alexandrium_andersonii.AAC.1